MKKMFTLVTGLLFAAALMAADRRPVVTINSNNNFKIVIDGKSYFGDNITIRLSDLYGNNHSIKVYEMRRGYFGRTERLISKSFFQTGCKDMMIRIDRFGNISIREKRNNGRYDRHDDWDRYDDRDRNRPGF
jgi:hypothetical protein